MPRLPTFRVSALADLAGQLRFGSRAALLRQISKAESLAGTIDPDTAYPLGWLTFVLTDYRSDSGEGGETVIPGAAILTDLSSLVEHLCKAGNLSEGDVPAGSYTTQQLAERWGVSRKTIDRYRRNGLIARRIQLGGASARLVFTPGCVEAFEQRNSSRLSKSRSFTRIDSATRSKLLRRASVYRRRLGWTLNQSAQRLSDRTGRSHETIRQLLQKHDERERATPSGRPIFGKPPTRDAAVRMRVLRAVREGMEPGAISQAFSGGAWSRRQVTHLIASTRLRLLRRLDLEGPVSPVFDHEDAWSILLAPDEVNRGLLSSFPSGPLDAWLVEARARKPDDRDTEARLITAYHFLRHNARTRIAALPQSRIIATELDEIETALRWARLLQLRSLGPQLGSMLATLESQISHPLERLGASALHALIRSTIRASGHAIDRFSPFRGARLASATGLVATRIGSEWTMAQKRATATGHSRAVRTIGKAGPRIDALLICPTPTWGAWLTPPHHAVRGLAALDDDPRRVLSLRYGLEGLPPVSVASLASAVGTTPMQIARRERAALRATSEAVASGHG